MKHEAIDFDRRRFLSASALAMGAFGLANTAFGAPAVKQKRIPVALATDIGDDIDDTWALGLLLKCPELELKLAVTDNGNPQYRGKLLAKFLQTTGHAHIPVGLGPGAERRADGPQAEWVKDYDLDDYEGTVHQDGARALVDTILGSPEPITLISVGPMPTVAAALALEPRIAERARFVGMYGSVRRGFGGFAKPSPFTPAVYLPSAEYNVKAAVKAAQRALAAPWDIVITPLDTCGQICLDGERYQRLLNSRDAVTSAVIENYRLWSRLTWRYFDLKEDLAEKSSSLLCDTVAVHLATAQEFCTMERLNIRVTDEALTTIDPEGKSMNVASAWKSIEGYKDWLVSRLLAHA